MTNFRCIDSRCTDGPLLEGQPAARYATVGLFCRRCYTTLERRLAETPAYLDLIPAYLGGHTTSRGDGRGSTAWPVPLNITAHDVLQDYAAKLSSWTVEVCEERNLRGPDFPDPRVLSGWLLHQLDWIVQQPWARAFSEEVRELTQAAEQVANARHHRYRLEPPCPSCNATELGRWDGSDQVDCASCGRSWPETQYNALVRVVLDSSRGCVTAAEAAEQLGLTVGAFWKLASRGKVRKLATLDGLARYSAADVAALLEEEAS